MSTRRVVRVTVNGKVHEHLVEPRLLLADFLRHTLGLTGTHVGCEHGVCGACTVIVDGDSMRSCLLFAVQLDGSSIVTVEGLGSVSTLGPLQEAFREHHAVQCGFCTPGMLMTVTDLLEKQPLATDQEIREGLSGNLCRCTGYQHIVDAVRTAAQAQAGETLAMSDAADLRPKMVGAAVARSEDPRLLAGRGSFVDDRQVARVLHVAFRRSDHAHARIVRIDASEARAAPGVVAVLTGRDLDGLYRPVTATSRMANYHATLLLPLAREEVRYVGEPVAAVLAESRYQAEDAVERIAIDFEALAVEVDPEAAARPGAPRLHETAESNVLVAREFKRGDVEAAFAEAYVTVEGRFRMRRKAAVAIEPRACLAEYDAGRDELVLHSATQIPGILRNALAEALDLPGHGLRVIAPDVGGGFGGKASLYPEELFVCLAARKLERPVKWTSDRIEDLIGTSQAFDEIVTAGLAVDRSGRMLGLAADVVSDVGAYSIYPWTAALEPVQVVSFLPGPYRVPNYRGRVRGVATPKAPTGPYRGVGRPISAFVMERLVDMAARKLGLDPKEIRERNLVVAEEFPYKVASGLVWDKSGFRECLHRACTAGDYGGLRARQAAARADGRWFGIGIACYAELTGIGSRISAAPGMPLNTGSETANIRIDPTGAVTAAFGIASHGQGLETTLAQIDRRPSRREVRGHPHRAWRQCGHRKRHGNLRQPQPGARAVVPRSGPPRRSGRK